MMHVGGVSPGTFILRCVSRWWSLIMMHVGGVSPDTQRSASSLGFSGYSNELKRRVWVC